MSALVKNLRLLQAWYLPAGPEPEEAMPSKYRAFKEAADTIESLAAQLALRSGDVAAWQLECERLRQQLAERDAENSKLRSALEIVHFKREPWQ